MRTFSDLFTILNAKDATGTGLTMLVEDYDHVVIQLTSATSANFTVKCQGSVSDDAPDFSASQVATNAWDYIDMIDLQNNASIDGDTGVAFAGTDDVRLFEVNVNALKWLCFTVTARSAGTVTVKAKGFSSGT